MDIAIQAEALRKSYKGRYALDGVDLAVPAGTVLGLLGPNGAGKTTAVRILTTLVRPDSGRATVAGYDVLNQGHLVRKHIGLSGQYAAVDDVLTGFENLVLLARLLRFGRRGSRARAEELLARFDLVDAANRPVGTYSGGMRRRLDLATCLIAEPPVLFLDEPTTGLDPRSRATLWAAIRQQVAQGTTVLLTTQYLEEADQLAARLVVIDSGRVIAEGTPDELKRKVGAERLEATVRVEQVPAAVQALAGIAAGPAMVNQEGDRISVPLPDGVRGVAAVATALESAGIDVVEFTLRRPSLDDVFFHFTGAPPDATPERRLQEAAA